MQLKHDIIRTHYLRALILETQHNYAEIIARNFEQQLRKQSLQ